MGMSEDEFLFMTPRAFHNKLRGFNHLRQANYEIVRLQTVELLNIQMERKHRIKDPKKLWKFPWEGAKILPDRSEEKLDRARLIEKKIKRFEERGSKQDDRDPII